MKDDALKWICEQSAAISNHPDVFSCTWIAEGIHESVYKVRKYMKELEAGGCVEKDYEGGIDYSTNKIYCIHGYSLTVKGREHKYYKGEYEKEVRWWDKHKREV